MRSLQVSIEINGAQTQIGTIEGNNAADACFQYAENYCENPDAAAVSISLPVRMGKYSPKETKNFFEGLLPEGFTRRSVAQWMHVDEEDYLSILAGLGNECLGAVRIRENSCAAEAGYRKLSKKQVAELAGEGAEKSAELVMRSHLSLTGATGKTGLYYDRAADEWYLPEGEAPSTHIVKQSHIRLQSIVVNEQLCLLAAKHLGIDVPESFIINTGTAKDGEILFATERYDRIFDPEGSTIDGLIRPLRLHQEDFAQALGISSAGKYESPGEEYLKAAFHLLASCSSDPIRDQLRLWDLVIFDYLVGNTDNHLKNISLLYDKNLAGIHLAPAYDIVSTAVYESCTRDMGMSIGGEFSLDRISRDSFADEAKKVGLGTRMALEHFDRLKENFRAALTDAADMLEKQGFSAAEMICGQILKNGSRQMTR